MNWTLRPSDQPRACNACRKTAILACPSRSSAIPINTPTRRTRSGCCARAASGHAAAALAKHIRKLPEQLRRSLTWDQGKEMSGHKRFTVATNVQVYFCDPRSPWQRGSNENTNGLLRQYFPRGTDLSRFSQAYLNGIALRLNQRPRKTLAFETPVNRLQLALH
jgi:IS30 family transposase